jgi:hypothetical protein
MMNETMNQYDMPSAEPHRASSPNLQDCLSLLRLCDINLTTIRVYEATPYLAGLSHEP